MTLRKTVLRDLAQSRETERWISGLATLVIFPIGIGVLGAFTPEIHAEIGAGVFWIWLAVAVLF